MAESTALCYSILDPTGNITALVESAVAPSHRRAAAEAVMRRHPEVEQVGFFRSVDGESVQAELHMAGGEFCGNASMCAAALYCLNCGEEPERVLLRVSGASAPVEVRLTRADASGFLTSVEMPPAISIAKKAFRLGDMYDELPLVELEGISHLIVRPDSAFFPLREDREAAALAVRSFCASLGADCLGFMFLEGSGTQHSLTPLVCVPGSGTLFWENSCASGSAATGMLLAAEEGRKVELELREPGGVLRVESDPSAGETRLFGQVRLLSRHSE